MAGGALGLGMGVAGDPSCLQAGDWGPYGGGAAAAANYMASQMAAAAAMGLGNNISMG
eukprot:gene11009-11163_t